MKNKRVFVLYTVTNKINQSVFLFYQRNKNINSKYFSTNDALFKDIKIYGINNFIKNNIAVFNTRNEVLINFRKTLVEMRKNNISLYNDMCYYGFVYLTTELQTNKKYIGQHRITGDPKIDNKYFGSGTIIGRILKSTPKTHEYFSREILAYADNSDELNIKERELIKQYNAMEDPMFYNIAQGGDWGDVWTGKSDKEKNIFRNIIAESNRHRKRDTSKISGANNPAFGRHWYKDILNHKQYYLFEDDPLIKQLNLIRGMFRTKEHNEKISAAHKGKTKNYVVYGKGKIIVNNGISDMYIEPEKLSEYLEKGYFKGGVSRSTKGCIHMNDGIKNYIVHPDQVEQYKSNGYLFGWIKH